VGWFCWRYHGIVEVGGSWEVIDGGVSAECEIVDDGSEASSVDFKGEGFVVL
jgi:hypothetical protein